MATERRMSWELRKLWSAGQYTLLADSYTADDGLAYSRGDTLSLGEIEATRLGNAGTIASPNGMYALKARVESGRGTVRDEYLYHMWELIGVWEDERGKP